MLSSRLTLISALVLLGAACGDNSAGTPDATPITQCNDGTDNDGDGSTDYPADPGCDSEIDEDESNPPIAMCGDGRDNDGDGHIDYPDDPGCFSSLANSEADDCPDGPQCPDCANGLDDDGDGLIDYPADPGCMAASEADEFEVNPVACGPNLTVTLLQTTLVSGTVPGTPSNLSSPTCGGAGGEVPFQISLTQPTVLVATTDLPGTTVDTVLYLRTDCQDAGTEITCNDDASTTAIGSTITAVLDAGTYYLVVEAAEAGPGGTFELGVQYLAGEGQPCTIQDDCGPGLQCRVPVGGSEMVCSDPVCSDGADSDGDGANDYPDDPGCDGPGDFDEADDCPSGPNCPDCADGVDNDGDLLVDYPDDPDCASASQPVEGCGVESDPIFVLASSPVMDDLTGLTDDFDLTCDSSAGGHLDRVHFVTVPAMESIVFDTEGSLADTAIALFPSTCAAPALGCDDDGGVGAGDSRLAFQDLAGGTYALVVENYGGASFPPGPYNLNVSGTIAAGGACDGPLATSGALTCGTGYACLGGVCAGNLACNNGMDDDADGDIDFPADPGCASALDTDEADDCPSGPGCPQCGNGVDDDGDGDIDYPADVDCASASDDDESPPVCTQESDPIVDLATGMVMSTLVGATDDFDLTCDLGATGHPDHVYMIAVPDMQELRIDTENSATDTVLALFPPTCVAPELACDDQGGSTGNSSLLVLADLPAGNYPLVVSSWGTTHSTYNLNVTGTITPGGACDGALAQAGVFTCGPGYTCTGGVCLGMLQCNNGVDDDGDGFVGYPDDPGCADPLDDDEVDDCPSGPGCPACGNTLDDDGDGDIDHPADADCDAASDDDEGTPACPLETDPILVLATGMVTGDLTGLTDDFDPGCNSSSGGHLDQIYLVDLPAMETVTFDTEGSTADTVLAIFDTTCGTVLECDDDDGVGAGDSLITRTDLPAGTYPVLVENFGGSTFPPGPYNLNVTGTIAPLGACDGALAVAGALTCPAGYACTGGVCLGTLQCNNGVDDDGDGFAGYPDDPGCTTPDDADETDTCPAGPGCPQCGNGLDDDGDGLVDYPDDPSCLSAAGSGEGLCGGVESAALTPIQIPVYAGTTVGAVNDFTPCSSSSTSTAEDRVYRLNLPVPVATLTLDTEGSALDTVLSFTSSECTVLACDDDGGVGAGDSLISRTNVAAGEYGIIVDGFSSSGSYFLNVRGTVAPGTACTDPLFSAGVLICPANHACTGGTCQPL